MVRELLVGIGACFAISALTACEGEDELGFCDSLCERVEECDSRARDGCEPWCSRVRTELSRVGDEMLDNIGQCASSVSCSEIMAGTFIEPCWEPARAEIEVSAREVAFCQAVLPKWFECGDRMSLSTCVENMKAWSGAVLTDAQACTAITDCKALFACTNEAFGGTDEES